MNNSIDKILKITSFWKKNLSVVPIVASEEEMKSEYFRYFLELENDKLDEEACAMKESNMAERISSLHEDIQDLKKQHKEDLECLKKGQEEIVRLLLSLTEVIEDNEETEEDDNHHENKSKMVHDTSNKVKVVQEKAKVKIMEIATNIENASPNRQPKPSKKVLENVKEQKNERGKKNDTPKPTRHSPRIKDLAPSFDLQISQS
ncbi:hypothetical protein E5676_scaffold994G00040 [Cucumis melo var. makuwa]|uniref:Uncharacterized protein n=1 Tax=Cucumis melo var. makuwa TaxID=1194695 RepID=A0A5D3CE15_CUCMM|nr:hypothetical protein E5676_scaffold994G00040 [Cucumis melo var. makuwa]